MSEKLRRNLETLMKRTPKETTTMTEVTNGTVDSAHYGPIGDAARNVASYCEGPARVHVYTAAFAALTTAQAEAEALRKEVEALRAESDALRELLTEERELAAELRDEIVALERQP